MEPRRQTTPDELRCLQHEAIVNMFCVDCQALGCLLCANEDEQSAHAGHQILPLTQAADFLKVYRHIEVGILYRLISIWYKNHNTFARFMEKGISRAQRICLFMFPYVRSGDDFYLNQNPFGEQKPTQMELLQYTPLLRPLKSCELYGLPCTSTA